MSSLTREELLIVLIEECGEVIQAATKCLRFGWDRDQPAYGVNHEVLAAGVGDLLGITDALDLDVEIVKLRLQSKLHRAEQSKAKFGVK